MTRHHSIDADAGSLRQFMNLWLEAAEARGCSPKTIDHYRREITQFLDWLESVKPSCTPEDVEAADIRTWIIRRRKEGISTHTLYDSYRNPRIFWYWMLREELTENNPFKKVDPPKRDRVMKPDLSPEEVRRLFLACRGKDWKRLRDRALLALILDTGMRIHEVQSLMAEDIVGDTVIIRGKGGKHRFVFLTAETRLTLRRYMNASPIEFQRDTPLWIGHQGPYTSNGLGQVIRDIGERAGITPLGPHRLRRTFATWSLRSGCDIETLRRLMGHSSLTVLQDYLALVETDLKAAHKMHSPMRRVVLEEGRPRRGLPVTKEEAPQVEPTKPKRTHHNNPPKSYTGK